MNVVCFSIPHQEKGKGDLLSPQNKTQISGSALCSSVSSSGQLIACGCRDGTVQVGRYWPVNYAVALPFVTGNVIGI